MKKIFKLVKHLTWIALGILMMGWGHDGSNIIIGAIQWLMGMGVSILSWLAIEEMFKKNPDHESL